MYTACVCIIIRHKITIYPNKPKSTTLKTDKTNQKSCYNQYRKVTQFLNELNNVNTLQYDLISIFIRLIVNL